jgi:putative resolvase
MKIYKPQEVAELLRVSYMTLYRWHKNGKLVAFRLPSGQKFYTEEQINKILQGGK